MNPCKVLIVEDEGIVAMDMAEQLAAMGYCPVGRAADGERALELTRDECPDLVLMDIRLDGDMDGISTAREIRRRFGTPVVFLTAHSDDETLERAKMAEPYGFILKPSQERELKSVIELALYKHRADLEIRHINRLYDVLSQVNQSVVRIESRGELLTTVCRLLVERGAMDLAWIGWLDEETHRINPVAYFGKNTEILSEADFYADDRAEGQGNPGNAIRDGKPYVCNECGKTDCLYPSSRAPARYGFQSCASFPLLFQGGVSGALSLSVAESGFFREREVDLLKEVAMDIYFALDKIESDAQRKLIYEQYQHQSMFLRMLMDAIPSPVFYKDAELRYLGCNTAFENALGVKRENLINRTVHDISPMDLADVHHRADLELLQGPGTHVYEAQVETADRVRRHVLCHKATFKSPDGIVGGMIGVVEDITERKQREADMAGELNAMSLLYQIGKTTAQGATLQETLDVIVKTAIALGQADLGSIRLFDQQSGSLELSAQHGFQQPWVDFWKKAGKDQDPFGVALQRGERIIIDNLAQNPALAGTPALEILLAAGVKAMVSTPLIGSKGRSLGMLSVYFERRHLPDDRTLQHLDVLGGLAADIIELTRTEEALRESEAKMRSVLDNIGIGVALISPQMEIIDMNRQMSKWFPGVDTGLHPICYRAFNDPPGEVACDNCPTSRTIQDGLIHEDTTQIRQAGSKRSYRIIASPMLNESAEVTAVIEMMEDITEKLSLEAQFRQAQKMEAVGRLAGGVAHDFNNMLGIILGYTELGLQKVDSAHPLYAYLQAIRKAGERSSDLTRQLLAFARKQTAAPEVLDLNETVEGMLKMLRRMIGEDINLAWLPGKNLWPVKVDPSQVDQILANLCVNARDAISGTGRVSIETDNVVFDKSKCAEHAGFVPGEYLMLSVSDDGCGMDKQILDKLFEPFFTTKGVGKGTGLGLSTVYGIVKQNNGFISVHSEPGHGTIVKVYLPRYVGCPGQAPEERPVEVPKGHGETLLLVEDELGILEMTAKMLESQEYKVLAASTPVAALRLAMEHTGEIHLLVSDVIMPEMNGRDLAQRLLPLYPTMKSLFMSGYTADVIAHHGVLDEGIHFIQKPFSMTDLAIKVRAALD